MTDTHNDYVILPLRARDAKNHQTTHGAYRGDNIRSLRMHVFRMKVAEFLEVAFGEGKK